MKVLSVDDKAENLYMIEALLRGYGHHVDSASDGSEALKLVERAAYDVVISDILMPRMDGFQLCRELKKDHRLKEIPFIFYTATYTDPKYAAFALSLGADRFLTKPLEPEEFVRAIQDVLAERARGGLATATREEEPEPEEIYLKEYNARLVAKLEQKMLELEAANRALKEDIAERERLASERSRLEQKLRQTQKMEAIGTLAGGIAHDFNNIIGGIIGFAELGHQDVNDPIATRQTLDEILRAGYRARDLVQQILAFSRQGEQPRQAFNPEAPIREALALLGATLPASIKIETSFEPALPNVLADATQIHQLVTNLVTNAWHAIGNAPGLITVQVATLSPDEEFCRDRPDVRPGRYIRLSVSDTGVGMDAATIERIFEPFFTTKPPGKGTGLGLSVVHGIMKCCDGGINVYSEPGQGTTIHLYFPAVDIEAAPAAVPNPSIPRGNGERILFVDDEPVLASLGERSLRGLNYEVVIATAPIQAITLFRDETFDLVITDLTMPFTNGIELSRLLWELKPEVPIILTTGFIASLDQEKSADLGFSDLLLKPYNIKTLSESVRSALAAAKL